MAKYIEREAAIKIVNTPNYNKHDMLFALKTIPAFSAADVVEVRHSHWVYDGYGEFHCHACKTIWHITEGTIDDLAFCPNCGAKMDGERKGGTSE